MQALFAICVQDAGLDTEHVAAPLSILVNIVPFIAAALGSLTTAPMGYILLGVGRANCVLEDPDWERDGADDDARDRERESGAGGGAGGGLPPHEIGGASDGTVRDYTPMLATVATYQDRHRAREGSGQAHSTLQTEPTGSLVAFC